MIEDDSGKLYLTSLDTTWSQNLKPFFQLTHFHVLVVERDNMASQFNIPEPLIFSNGNIYENLKIFKQELRLYLTATEKLKKPSEVKTSIILNCIGKQGHQIYNNFEFSSVNYEMNYDRVMTKFEQFCIPRKDLTLVRYQFLPCPQDEADKFDYFVNKLKTLSHECELKELRDSLIKDMLIIGTNDLCHQKKLLSETDLTLEFAIKAYQTVEATRQQVELLQKEPKEVNFTKSGKNSYQPAKKLTLTKGRTLFSNRERITECKFFSYSYFRGNCPSYNQICNTCRKRNHFTKMCPSKEHVEEIIQNAQDDIIIWVATSELLEKRTIEVLQAVRRSGLKLSRTKCQFNQHQLTFLRHMISSKGMAPDARKIKAIADTPEPTNQRERPRFFGINTYLGKFLLNLSTKIVPLCLLLGKDTIWSFDKPQKEAPRL